MALSSSFARVPLTCLCGALSKFVLLAYGGGARPRLAAVCCEAGVRTGGRQQEGNRWFKKLKAGPLGTAALQGRNGSAISTLVVE